jgi:serine-type D-Ala-D-Ala endopeptidase (penicillin-binding protein 7)
MQARWLVALFCSVVMLGLHAPDVHAASEKKKANTSKKKPAAAQKKSSAKSLSPRARAQEARVIRVSAQSLRAGAKVRMVPVRKVVWVNGKKRTVTRMQRVVFVPPKPSFGQLAGLHGAPDPLELRSSVALVTDQATGEVLFTKNAQAVLPIASITKVMTAMVVLESGQSMAEPITITQADVDTEKGSRSRLRVGTTLSRQDALHLALMNSENRAAHALGRTYPGGVDAAVAAMNAKARLLGMSKSSFADPTGLSSRNVSTAEDLTKLMQAAYAFKEIRDWSISPEYAVDVLGRHTNFGNTNRLIKNDNWEIGLQKTGYISEAGQCLIMQARIEGRGVLMVFLDSQGKLSRLGDAQRVREWLETNSGQGPVAKPGPTAALPEATPVAAVFAE